MYLCIFFISLCLNYLRFTSGVALLSANNKAANGVKKALERAQGMRIVPATYWAVTTRVPHVIHGEKRLAMRMKEGPDRGKKLVTALYNITLGIIIF